MKVQGYTPADLARLRTIQINAGRTRPRVREYRQGLRTIRWIGRPTESGAIAITREYWDQRRRHDRQDATVYVPPLRGPLLIEGGSNANAAPAQGRPER